MRISDWSSDVCSSDLRRAAAAWTDLVGPDADVRHAASLEADVRAYHQAVVDLGGAAEEIIALRRELERRAGPALVAAIERLHELCEPYGLGDITAAHLGELGELIARAIERGRVARVHLVLDAARAEAASERSGERRGGKGGVRQFISRGWRDT